MVKGLLGSSEATLFLVQVLGPHMVNGLLGSSEATLSLVRTFAQTW